MLTMATSGCSDENPTMKSACAAYNTFLDAEASGTRTANEGRDAYRDEVHSKATEVSELADASERVLRGYTTYVEGGPSTAIESGMREFSTVCDDNGFQYVKE